MADADLVDTLPAGLRRLAADAHLAQDDLRVLEGDAVVVDHQHAQLSRVQLAALGLRVFPVRLAQGDGDGEGAALPLLALHLNVPVHQLYHALRDGHAQTRAAVAAGGGGVLLAEGVKDVGQVLFAHADAGIPDDEPEGGHVVVAGPLLDQKPHGAALRREFHGVAQDVDHHLLELHGVADVGFVDRALDLAVVLQALVPALADDDGVDLLQGLGEGELLLPDGHAPGLDAAHVQDVVDDPQQVVGGGADLFQILLDPVAGAGVVHGDVVEPDDGVHGGADLVAHVGEKGRLGLVGLLGGGQRVPQGLPALRQLLLLLLLPLQGALQLQAVLLLFVLHHEAVQHAGAQHVAHGVVGHQGIEDLDGDQGDHGDAEQADGQMPLLFCPLRPGGDGQGIGRGQQEHEDLNGEGQIPGQARMVGPVGVEAEKDGGEEIHQDHDDLKDEEGAADIEQELPEDVLALQIGDDVLRPQHHRRGHGRKVHRRVRVEDGGPAPDLQNAPEQVGHIVGHHAHQKQAVIPLHRRQPPGPPQDVPVVDQQDQGCKDSDDGIGHGVSLPSFSRAQVQARGKLPYWFIISKNREKTTAGSNPQKPGEDEQPDSEKLSGCSGKTPRRLSARWPAWSTIRSRHPR